MTPDQKEAIAALRIDASAISHLAAAVSNASDDAGTIMCLEGIEKLADLLAEHLAALEN